MGSDDRTNNRFNYSQPKTYEYVHKTHSRGNLTSKISAVDHIEMGFLYSTQQDDYKISPLFIFFLHKLVIGALLYSDMGIK